MDLEMDLDLDVDLDLEMDLDMDLDLEMEMEMDVDLDMDLDLDLDMDMDLDLDMDMDVEMEMDMDVDLDSLKGNQMHLAYTNNNPIISEHRKPKRFNVYYLDNDITKVIKGIFKTDWEALSMAYKLSHYYGDIRVHVKVA